MSDRQTLLELIVALRARLEWCRDTGVETADVDGFDVRRTSPIVGGSEPAALRASARKRQDENIGGSDGSAATPTTTRSPATSAVAPVSDPGDATEPLIPAAVLAAADLPQLRAAIGDCTRCKLAPHRTNLVFGVGNPAAELVFVGEAPGRDEDLRGEPFVGRAGQLLTEIITKGMKVRREDVYIANIIKCRPPQNRNPEPDEIASCEPFLVRQLALIGPKAIVALGTFAAQTLLKTRTPITRLRGVWADYHGIPLMPTFHPAYLLRNPAEKRLVWEDIQQVMRALGLPR
jgi:uracil-DNA glycosylase family 4